MAVLEDLSEEEAYLYALLQDPSGIDLAEFTWVYWEAPDLCWRAWPFQWKWWHCQDPLQIDQCARSIGKSMGIKLRAYAFPHVFPGQEMVITAPEGVHLDAITDVIETAYTESKLGSEMLAAGRSGVKHKPFHMNLRAGSRIMGRIPHRDGSAVKGIHPIRLELDEAQDYPRPGWIELNETLKRGSVGATWRAHGVTRGVRDEFWKYTQPDSAWTVHSYCAMWRPNWTDEERQEKIEQYGGRDDPDYRRNVLGEHGDEVSPLFVLHRLMNCVDDNYESTYNTDEYVFIKINDAYLKERGFDEITKALDLPLTHTSKYQTFWCGMDVGYTNHPSEILVFAEEMPKAAELRDLKRLKKAIPPEGMPRLKLLTRIQLKGISAPDQFEVLKFLIRHYKPKAFAMDKSGNGLPLFQFLENESDKLIAETIRGYNFSEKVLVDFDPTIEVDDRLSKEDMAKEVGIKRNVPDYATDVLRLLVDSKRLWLPWDRDLISEFEGQTYKVTKTTMDQYGRREYSMGTFHALDAARMTALAWKQHAIEEFMKADEQEAVPVFFVEM